MSRPGKERAGAVLLSAIGALVLIFIFLGSFLTLNALRAGIIIREGNQLQAYYAARTGMEAAVYFINSPGLLFDEPPRALSGVDSSGGLVSEKVYVYFHEREEGVFFAKILDNAECSVRWNKIEAADSVYIISSTGSYQSSGGRISERTLTALVQEENGSYCISGWYE